MIGPTSAGGPCGRWRSGHADARSGGQLISAVAPHIGRASTGTRSPGCLRGVEWKFASPWPRRATLFRLQYLAGVPCVDLEVRTSTHMSGAEGHPFSSQHLPRLRRCGAQRGARGRPCGGVSMTGPGPLPVLVARGGVAGPGSLLARRHLARERMERTLLTPGRGSSGTGPRHSPSCSRAGVRGGSARRDPRGLGGRVVICGSQVEDRSRLAVANAGERLSYEARVVTVGAGSDRCHRHPGPDPHPSRARLWARATHP